ncbi:MAG: sortase [Candidatus Nomurabacteria bacterium]|jgi:sortase A|nr:sortase [Candidatus Nomurabacteria bacterium]
MTHNITEKNNKRSADPRGSGGASRSVNVPERGLQVERAKKISHQLADQTAKKQAETEARRKYHKAWQEYYQKYYEHYYLRQLSEQKQDLVRSGEPKTELSERQQAISELKKDLLKKISEGAGKVKKSPHFRPILSGVIAMVLFVFVQYNQLFSAAVQGFVSPSEDSTSLIIADGTNQPVGKNPTVLIPKISVKAPIIFNLKDLTESTAQSALEKGVINFPVSGATARPGQNGNTVLLGHSSSDIFNGGQYKFIFVQLNRLTQDDLFYIDYNKVRYTYQVTDKKTITPKELGQLNLGDGSPYATLVTCDPPGTTLKRLLVTGRQINPDPKKAAKQDNPTEATTKDIPGNPPTLFEKLFQ